MASNEVVVALRAVGQAAFTAAMDQASKSVTGVGKASTQADKSTQGLAKGTSKLRASAGTLAKWAGGAAAIYKGQQYLRSATTATMDLAKSTFALQRATGLDTETASQWAEVLKVRGLNTKTFQVGMTKLSKTMELARAGNAKASATLAQYGVTSDQVAKGDTSGAITNLADSFALMKNPAEKAALAQQLFGKSGQQLLPIFSKGSQGLQDQLDMASKYGATLSGKGAKGAADLIARQRELQMASDGVKVQLGQALIPVMAQVAQIITQVVAVLQPLLRDSTTLKILLGALTLAFVAYKVATIASTIATLGFNAAFLLIPLAVIALVAALVIAYKKVGWFRDAVDAAFAAVKSAAIAVFTWIKTHWPLLAAILTGPIGLAVYGITKNWDKIKAAARSVVDTIKRLFGGLPRTFVNLGKGIVDALVSGIKAAPGKLLDAIKSLVPGKLRGVGDKIGLWATGGLVPTRQWGIVGERGPELLELPGGSRITPLPSVTPSAPSLDAGAAMGRGQTTAHFYLDRRLVATAVAEDTADQQARR